MLQEPRVGVLALILSALRRRADRPTHLDEDARAALDACPDAVLGIDVVGTCVLVNPAAVELFGRTEHDLVGTPAVTLVPTLAEAVRDVTARRRAGERTPGPMGRGMSTAALVAGRTPVPVQVWISPAYHRARRLTLFVTVRDLRAERAAEAARRSLLDEVVALRDTVHAVTTAVTDRAILLADAGGHITALNRAAEKLLGYRSEDVVGKPTTALSAPDDIAAVRDELGVPAGVDPLLEITRSGLPNQQKWRLLTRDGEARPVTLTITGVGDRQDPRGFVLAVAPRRQEWEPLMQSRTPGDRLLLDLDDAETRALRWQVGGGAARRR